MLIFAYTSFHAFVVDNWGRFIDKIAWGNYSFSIKTIVQERNNNAFSHFERPRLKKLFMEAVKYPVIVVCAGAGYGKTSAVHDFVEQYQATTKWMQLSERDNIGARFWENFNHTLALYESPFAGAIAKLSFPDTREKINQYLSLVREHTNMKRRILVMDDFHCIEDASVHRFLEECVFLTLPPGSSVILISRSASRINTASFESKRMLFTISENDLRFTESELAQYFHQLSISPPPESLRDIMQDTQGWVFAINLIARSYQKAPGYEGYLRNAMKLNIFRLMESEIWDGISEHLQYFLIRLSLIDHLSIDLITLLAKKDKELINDMEKQSAYIHRDSYINAYLIHPLFLEFLAEKQELLSVEQKNDTYKTTALWCVKNGFKTDALSYYEKTDDYASIVSVLYIVSDILPQIPQDIAQYAATIFERAPAHVFDVVEGLAVLHLRSLMCQGLWQQSVELAEYYEAKFLKLPEDDPFRKRTLGSLYYVWAFLRNLMCLMDDRYDFDIYIEKFSAYIPESFNTEIFSNHNPGPWLNCAGSARKGAPEEYISALSRSITHLSRSSDFPKNGIDELARGELLFFQGDLSAAESFIAHAMDRSREVKQFELMHRALFYMLRLAVSQGDYPKMERTIRDLKAQLDYGEYTNRYVNYDISLAWYYYILGLPEKVPDWLKENFTLYYHASFIENFGNQMKARFCYMTRTYPPLLSYIEGMKARESFLFGRVEMLAIEACVHYKMKDRQKAFAALLEAYKTASPNNLVMPFIELGKDMRTLTSAALKESDSSIPAPWLENINRKSASYAKQQSHVSTEYRRINGIIGAAPLSTRETEILIDLSRGLSRTEIAASRDLSVNTVKMVINNIYSKLGTENLATLIRIAVERKLI
jgi:LuxR family maltose regulon positive regulatory protein